MSRIKLSGLGDPIPDLAIPVSESTDGQGGTWISLPDGAIFKKQEWLDKGFTNFEVYVVGAQGGRGGSWGDAIVFPLTIQYQAPTSQEQAAMNVFLQLAQESYDYAHPQAPLYTKPAPSYGRANYFEDTVDVRTWYRQIYETPVIWEPDSDIGFTGGRKRHFDALLYDEGTPPNLVKYGGAGGGGGLQKFGGILGQLADEIPVLVGKAGARGQTGHYSRFHDTVAPNPIGQEYKYRYESTGSDGVEQWEEWSVDGRFTTGAIYYGTAAKAAQLNNAIDILYNYDITNAYIGQSYSFAHPLAGEDGGFSRFGDLAVASGGKGGAPSIVYLPAQPEQNRVQELASGGAGGIGGQETPGGGAAGSTTTTDAQDGTWNGVIGKGGGGGRPMSSNGLRAYGGRGSYGFDDTSVFGKRGTPSAVLHRTMTYDPATGELVSETAPPNQVYSGGFLGGPGGGAGLNRGQYKYGSSAEKGQPDGAVYIRLTTVDL